MSIRQEIIGYIVPTEQYIDEEANIEHGFVFLPGTEYPVASIDDDPDGYYYIACLSSSNARIPKNMAQEIPNDQRFEVIIKQAVVQEIADEDSGAGNE